MSWVAAAVAATAATAKIAGAISQKRKAKKALKEAGKETVSQELLANQRMAKERAAEGLPSEQYANAMKNIQRSQLTALKGARDRRGGLASIGEIQQGTNDAYLDLDIADANAKRDNERILMAVNNQVGGKKDNMWERQYNYGMSLLGASNQNWIGAFDSAGAAGGGLASGLIGNGGRGSAAGNNYYVPPPNNKPAELVQYQRPEIGGLLPRSRNIIIR